MRKEDFFLLAKKYLEGKATEQDTQLLNEWYESFDDSLVEIPAGSGESEHTIQIEMLTRLKSSLNKETAKADQKVIKMKSRPNWMAAAAILLFLIAGAWFLFIRNTEPGNSNGEIAYERMAPTTEEEVEEHGDEYDHPNEAAEFQALRTRDITTGKVPTDKLWSAILQTQERKAFVANSTNVPEVLNWLERGPDSDVVGPSNGNTRANNGVTSGRIDAIWVDLADPTGRTVWIGADAGGVWKTNDITASPATWNLVNDYFGNLFISSITQDPTNHDIMYFATGEAYYGGEDGIGVFKSTNHGVTWNLLPSSTAFIYGSRILCDPAGNVYLGTRNQGIQRSTDEGDTWTTITPSGVNNRICDLELSSTGRLHLVAGISGTPQTYRFTDNPATVTSAAGWTTPTTTFTSGSERAEIGVSGNTLYALPSVGNQVPTIWKSSDGGVNWSSVGAPPNMVTGGSFANGQGFYNLAVAVNPANPDECVIGGIDNARTINGGTTWTRISDWVFTTGQYVHADQHTSVWYDNGNKLLFGCDGGIHYSEDKGVTIRDRNVNLRLKEFYSGAIHPNSTTSPNYILGGTQDNGTHQLNNPGLGGSVEVTGGDGGYVAIDNDQPQFQVATYVFANFRRSSNGGANWSSGGNNNTGQFINPFDYDNVGNRVYAGTSSGQYLRWDNPQSGFTYTNVSVAALGGAVASVFVSPFTANRVYFGTTGGRIVVVDNAHQSPATGTILTGAGMPAGYLNCINAGSTEQNLVVVYSNFNTTNIWVSNDGGTNWTTVDGNLPNMPIYWALYHPDDDTKMYVATETGVWETNLLNGATTNWVTSPSFPTVRTTMLDYRSSDRTILAATYGRGFFTSTVPLPTGFDLGSPVPATSACPAPATMSISLPTTSNGGFVNPISFVASGAPSGTTVSFSPATVVPGNAVTVTLNNTNTLSAGSYTIAVTGSATGAPDVTRNLTFTITAGAGPTIGTQPASQTVCAGVNVTFTVVATGTYQWQVSTAAVPAFTNIGGQTTASLTLNAVTTAMNGNQYRVVVSNQCGSTNSDAATLTVSSTPSITANPQDVTLCAGSNHTFTVTAPGTGLTFVWEESTNGGGTYSPIVNGGVYSGQGTTSLTLTGIIAAMNTNRYRVVVSGGCPPPATSTGAILSVVTSVTVTTQPVNSTICDGASTTFTVAGSGPGIIYQWQVNTGAGFTNLSNGAPYSGVGSGTLTITGATPAMNGYQYRAQLSNSTCPTPGISSSATLTVNTLPSISGQPTSATICLGGNNTFSSTATGTGITYQWQVSTAAVPAFTDIPGANSASFSVTGATAGMNGNQYRVVVSGTCTPAATSSAATLTVILPAAVAAGGQPQNSERCSGDNTTFSVTAAGTGTVNYQWQVSTDNGTTWNNISGANANTLALNGVVAVMNGNLYRVLLSNATCTTPTPSSNATLAVRQLPSVTLVSTQPTSLLPGQTATLTATPTSSTGGVLTTTWTRDNATVVVPGNSLAVTVANLGSYQVSIRETWPSSLFCSNLSQIVTLDAAVSTRLFIYPSPNDGRFTVSYYNNGGTATQRTIVIVDSKGAEVYNSKFAIVGSYTLINIDLQRASTGIYYVRVGDATGKKLADGKVHIR